MDETLLTLNVAMTSARVFLGTGSAVCAGLTLRDGLTSIL